MINPSVGNLDLKERCTGSSLRREGRAGKGRFAADSRTSHLLQEGGAVPPCLRQRHRASARGNLRTSCVQRKPVDSLSRWEALGQARGDQGLRPLRHARLPWEAQPRVLMRVIAHAETYTHALHP